MLIANEAIGTTRYGRTDARGSERNGHRRRLLANPASREADRLAAAINKRRPPTGFFEQKSSLYAKNMLRKPRGRQDAAIGMRLMAP